MAQGSLDWPGHVEPPHRRQSDRQDSIDETLRDHCVALNRGQRRVEDDADLMPLWKHGGGLCQRRSVANAAKPAPGADPRSPFSAGHSRSRTSATRCGESRPPIVAAGKQARWKLAQRGQHAANRTAVGRPCPEPAFCAVPLLSGALEGACGTTSRIVSRRASQPDCLRPSCAPIARHSASARPGRGPQRSSPPIPLFAIALKPSSSTRRAVFSHCRLTQLAVNASDSYHCSLRHPAHSPPLRPQVGRRCFLAFVFSP